MSSVTCKVNGGEINWPLSFWQVKCDLEVLSNAVLPDAFVLPLMVTLIGNF